MLVGPKALIERALREPLDVPQRLSLQALQLWLQQRRGDAAATVAQAPAVIAAVPPGVQLVLRFCPH